MQCSNCQTEVLDIDVKCPKCGHPVSATGAHRMLGQTFLGTYELVDVLGQGGMSVVFKAKHKMTDQEVALKILPPELAAHAQVKSRFLEEAKALAALDHPNIVHLYNFGQENGSFILAMQYVQGRTWERMILEKKRLDWITSCRITIDVLKALEYAHGRGIVHRDMKPSNVLVRGHDGAATVMDFGIAKMAQSTRLTATGQTMGTVRYMSPEQVRGQEVDLRTDIYSLGATVYESLVGDTPFEGQTHFEIMTKQLSELPKRPSLRGVELPEDVEDAVMRALAKRAEDRFESAREMRKILENALRGKDVALVETQKLDSGDLKDVRSGALTKAEPALRAASAADLADQLEPGSSSVARVRVQKPGKGPWIALALALVAAAGVGVAVIMKAKASSYAPVTAVKGVSISDGKRAHDVLFETDGAVTPDEIATAYKATLDDIQQFDPKVRARFRVVDTVAAIPGARLCDGAITRASLAPCVEGTTVAVSALGKGGSHTLLVDDRKDKLAETMRVGLAQAVCDFQPVYLDASKPDDQTLLKEVCALTERFGAGKR